MEDTRTEQERGEQTLGTFLKAQREMRQISHQEICRVTKINIGILKALEEDDYSRLPAPPFVKGFLASIGKYLGLDTHDLLLRYEQALEHAPVSHKVVPLPRPRTPTATTPVAKQPAPGRSPTASHAQPHSGPSSVKLGSQWEKWFNRKTISFYLIFVVTIIVLVLLKSVGRQKVTHETPQPTHAVPTPPPVPEVAVTAPTGKDAPPIPSPADLNKTETAPEPPLQPPAAKTTAATPAKQMPATPTAALTPPPSAPTPAPPVAKVEKSAPAAPAPAPVVPSEQELIIKAKVDTFFKIQVSDQAIQNITLRSGETTSFKSKEKIKLLILNAGSIFITHNGKKVGQPGPWGKDMILEYAP
jgi:cytoskeletal protein RodZ